MIDLVRNSPYVSEADKNDVLKASKRAIKTRKELKKKNHHPAQNHFYGILRHLGENLRTIQVNILSAINLSAPITAT